MWARVVEHDLRTNGLSVSSVYRTGDEACPTLYMYAARTLSHRESRRSVSLQPRCRGHSDPVNVDSVCAA